MNILILLGLLTAGIMATSQSDYYLDDNDRCRSKETGRFAKAELCDD